MINFGTVSVILPVYGVEKYLKKCLDSVCSQTYPYLEIIIIDDESPDNSGNIADDFAAKDNRVKVLHIKNKGAAGARNVGLDNCNGSYVFFVDSDDWIENDAIEKMIYAIKKNDADIVQCQYIDEFTNKSQKHICKTEYKECNDETFISQMIPYWEYILIWNKLYKSELFNNVRFKSGHCIDDEFFTYKVIMNSKKIYFLEEYLYHYRLRRSSAMGNTAKAKQRLNDQVEFITERYPILVKKYPNLQAILLSHMLEVLMSVMRNGSFDEEIYNYAKSNLQKYTAKALFSTKINLSLKKSVLSYTTKKRERLTPDVSGENNVNYFD